MINLSFKKNEYNIKLKGTICKNSILQNYMKYNYFTSLCKNGCKHYNLSYTCPPNSPTFTEYAKDYDYSLIILIYTEITPNNHLEDTYYDLRKILSDFLIPLEDKFNGLLTDGGRCLYCKKCLYVDNLPCKYPDKIRFSMEAMGIDLDKISKDILNHSISWNEDYCTVIGSINFNGDFTEYDFKDFILKVL